ncbi:protein disulfide-isomerase tmx3a-like [Polymixia lowei]
MSNIKNNVIFAVLLSLTVSAFVEELDDTFMKTKGTEEIWLIKFYAPRCAFCKQLDPVWHQIGSELKSLGSPVNVGKCEATANTGLAKEFQVRGYPAILMLKNDVKYNYQGPRTKDSIIDFANRVAGPAVRTLSSLQLFQHVMSRHNVLFVYIGASSPLKGEYIATAKELIVHTYFFSGTRDILPKSVTIPSLPAVVVFKDGTYFTYNEEHDGELKTWINRERFLTYSKLDSYTLYAMGDTAAHQRGAYGIRPCWREWPQTTRSSTANFYFGYMEDNDYIKGLVMGEVTTPSIIVVKLSNDGYFLPPGAVETEAQLLDFLNGVLDNSLECQGGNDISQRFKRFSYEVKNTLTPIFSQNPILGWFLVNVPLGIVVLLVYFCYKRLVPAGPDSPEAVSRGEERGQPSGERVDTSRGQQQKKLADKKAD